MFCIDYTRFHNEMQRFHIASCDFTIFEPILHHFTQFHNVLRRFYNALHRFHAILLWFAAIPFNFTWPYNALRRFYMALRRDYVISQCFAIALHYFRRFCATLMSFSRFYNAQRWTYIDLVMLKAISHDSTRFTMLGADSTWFYKILQPAASILQAFTMLCSDFTWFYNAPRRFRIMRFANKNATSPVLVFSYMLQESSAKFSSSGAKCIQIELIQW